MAEPMTSELFASHVGETFRMIVNDEWEIHMRLSSVTPVAGDRGGERVPFSLIFHAPPLALVEQQIFGVEHDSMEPFVLFLVPLGPDDQGMRYQAVFT
jgi:hypothetical protein